MTLKTMSPIELEQKLARGEAILIDVRDADEHAREHIEGALLAPLSTLATRRFDNAAVAVFHCRSGMRTQANAARLLACGFREAYCLDGGIEAWKAAGLPVRANRKAPLEIIRQVQIAAGSLVLLGVALGWFAHPAFFGLSAFVGAGLAFAGVTGWCGMALLLKAMPWNRAPA